MPLALKLGDSRIDCPAVLLPRMSVSQIAKGAVKPESKVRLPGLLQDQGAGDEPERVMLQPAGGTVPTPVDQSS